LRHVVPFQDELGSNLQAFRRLHLGFKAGVPDRRRQDPMNHCTYQMEEESDDWSSKRLKASKSKIKKPAT
ncbi:hypothetical protein KI387_042024, partial [Taxus chinensis]